MPKTRERRLEATQAELDAIEAALAALPARKEVVLGADEFDEAALDDRLLAPTTEDLDYALGILWDWGVEVFRCFLIQRKKMWMERTIRQQLGLRLRWPSST